MNTPKLPPPDHPEPHVMTWSELEKRTILEFGAACYAAAIEAQGVPDGWQLVPKEPTDEMCEVAMAIDPDSTWQIVKIWPDGSVHKSRESDAAIYYRAMLASAPPAPQAKPQPLSDEQIEIGRAATFSTNNPFCPCDSKTMRKAVRWAEAAHGIKGE